MNFTNDIHVELLDACASDLDVVNSARVSFDRWQDHHEEGDAQLIDFLLRNRHGSPFEHGYFKFRVEAPIFAFREHHRHRVGHSYNEMSARYVELAPDFYVPYSARTQKGSPGSYYFEEHPEDSFESEELTRILKESYSSAWDAYQYLLRHGIAKEQARMVLPVGIFSKMVWSCNPRSLMHYLGLRNHKSAQKEIQMIAVRAEDALAAHMPMTYASFVKNDRIAP